MVPDHSLEDIKRLVFDAVDDASVDRESVVFVYVFGSFVEEKGSAHDIDVCISLDEEMVADDLEKVGQKISGRLPGEIHLSVFEQLPLQVKNQVFKGELIYKKDKQVYDKALETFRRYDFYEPLYKEIIGA